MTPNIAIASISRLVAIGRLMKISERFISDFRLQIPDLFQIS